MTNKEAATELRSIREAITSPLSEAERTDVLVRVDTLAASLDAGPKGASAR